jgi:hypothetical protein
MAIEKNGARAWMITVVIAVPVVLAGCVSPNQAASVKPSGFLGDSAALLQKGGKSDFLLVYRKKDLDWKVYSKIILDPVTLWGIENSKLPSDQLADFQKLVDQFYAMLKARLSKDYELTDTPSGGAMRIQIAIINGERANAPLKIAKGFIPYAGYADTFGPSPLASRRSLARSRSSTWSKTRSLRSSSPRAPIGAWEGASQASRS